MRFRKRKADVPQQPPVLRFDMWGPPPINHVQLAVETGQLTVEEHILDDEPDSPTEGQYFAMYRETTPVRD